MPPLPPLASGLASRGRDRPKNPRAVSHRSEPPAHQRRSPSATAPVVSLGFAEAVQAARALPRAPRPEALRLLREEINVRSAAEIFAAAALALFAIRIAVELVSYARPEAIAAAFWPMLSRLDLAVGIIGSLGLGGSLLLYSLLRRPLRGHARAWADHFCMLSLRPLPGPDARRSELALLVQAAYERNELIHCTQMLTPEPLSPTQTLDTRRSTHT